MPRTTTAASTPTTKTQAPRRVDDRDYHRLERLIAKRVAALSGPLFTSSVDPGKLWDAYLGGLPKVDRQHYNCHACRRFIQTYGGLLVIPEGGKPTPAVWDLATVPASFRRPVARIMALFDKAKVTGVFLYRETIWGQPEAGGWSHIHARPTEPYTGRVLTAEQAMAEKREEHGMLRRALAEYPKATADETLRVLRANVLPGSEKALHIAEWFAALHGLPGHQLWRAVALAPAGYCHIKTTMISTLLDDIRDGLRYEVIERKWREKMHPLQYQRPQAPPKVGTIQQAEKLVETLGVQRSLERRYATLDDVREKLWEPRPTIVKPGPGGVFGHLIGVPKEPHRVQLPPTKVTWAVFVRDVLPRAAEIEYQVQNKPSPFYGLTTAVHADAPPILQWDNPVAWYFTIPGSYPHEWGLPMSGWVRVTAMFKAPFMWGGASPSRWAPMVHFALDRCAESRPRNLCLFPETLRSEYHGIRSVVEAHSKSTQLQRDPNGGTGTANGVVFTGDDKEALTVRVNGSEVYTIDRWE